VFDCLLAGFLGTFDRENEKNARRNTLTIVPNMRTEPVCINESSHNPSMLSIILHFLSIDQSPQGSLHLYPLEQQDEILCPDAREYSSIVLQTFSFLRLK
jgi:hypothetical protein